MDTDPDLAAILGDGAGDGTTMSSYDSATGQTVLHHWGDDGSSVALVYDPWGVVVGAEVVSAEGDVLQVSGDGVAEVVTDLLTDLGVPGGGAEGAARGLFGNPHGWVIVPAVVALSRLAGAVRR